MSCEIGPSTTLSLLSSGCQPTDPSSTAATSSSEAILHGGLRMSDMSAAESISNIRSLIHSPYRIAAARSLRGKEAQGPIDYIDQVITLPELDEKLRKQCSHLLYKICTACIMLPTSFLLQQESVSVGRIRYTGGFAEVREGEYLGRRVAIKDLKIKTKEVPSSVFKFCREIISWKRLSHPNVLPFLGVAVSTDPQYFRIASDWMQNGNIMEYTRSKPKANRPLLLSEVMCGVTYLHDLGVVHGDLKGANVLVDDNGTARLADFGLITTLADLSTIPLSATTALIGGTIRYLSPERLGEENSPPTCESDCYALGMVIYEVLTGVKPFSHLADLQVVYYMGKGDRPRKPDDAEALGFSDTLWQLVQCVGAKHLQVDQLPNNCFSISETLLSTGYPLSSIPSPTLTEAQDLTQLLVTSRAYWGCPDKYLIPMQVVYFTVPTRLSES